MRIIKKENTIKLRRRFCAVALAVLMAASVMTSAFVRGTDNTGRVFAEPIVRYAHLTVHADAPVDVTVECSADTFKKMYVDKGDNSEVAASEYTTSTASPYVLSVPVTGAYADIYVAGDLPVTGISSHDDDIVSVELQSCTGLEKIDFSGCDSLTEITARNRPELKTVDCTDSAVSLLNLLGSDKITSLKCSGCKLNFNSLPLKSDLASGAEYVYAPQDEMALPEIVKAGSNVSAAAYRGVNSVTKWYDGTTEISDSDIYTTSSTDAGKTLHATVTDPDFPGLTLTSNDFTVDTDPAFLGYYKNSTGETKKLTDTGSTSLTIGNGTETVTEISIPYATTITDVTIKNPGMTDLDLYTNHSIKKLTAENGKIQQITPPRYIEELDVSGNEFADLDLDAFSSLKKLDASGNRLTTVSLPAQKLDVLDLSDNSFSFKDLPSTDCATDYNYLSQSDITIAPTVLESNETITLSGYGADTVTWYDAASGQPVTGVIGNKQVYSFGAAAANKDLYAKLTNEDFPGLELKTTVTHVEPIPKEQYLITYNSTAKTAVIKAKADDTIYADIDGKRTPLVKGADGTQSVSLTLSGSKKVKLYCADDIKELDIADSDIYAFAAASGNTQPKLEKMDISGNGLETVLNLSSFSSLKELDCTDNALSFKSLILPETRPDGAKYTCTPQEEIDTGYRKIEADTNVDLTPLNRGELKYTWYDKDGNVIIPTSTSGKVVLDSRAANKDVYCELTNDNMPELVLRTNTITVGKEDDAKKMAVAPCVAAFTTANKKGDNFTFTATCSDDLYVDWGDGVRTALDPAGKLDNRTVTGKLKGTNVKLYTSGALTDLKVSGNALTEAHVEDAPALKTLDVSENDLESLNVTKNPELATLKCAKNKLTYKSLPVHTTKLTTIDASAQKDLPIPSVKASGKSIDLSDQKTYEGKDTVYTWCNAADNKPVAGVSENPKGVFTFSKDLEGKTLYCKMDNPASPELLRTTNVTVSVGGKWFIDDKKGIIADAKPSADAFGFEPNNAPIAICDLEKATTKTDDVRLQLITGDVDSATKTTVLKAIDEKYTPFKSSSNRYDMYDISLVCSSSDAPVKNFGGSFAVSLKYPSSVASNKSNYHFHVLHYDKTKGLEEVKCSAGSDSVSFNATSFSPYTLIWLTDDEEKKLNDDNGGGSGNGGSGNGGSGSGSGSGGSGSGGSGSGGSGSGGSGSGGSGSGGSGSGSGSGTTPNNTPGNTPNTGDTDPNTTAPKTGENTTLSTAAWIILSISAIMLIAVGIIIFRRKHK